MSRNAFNQIEREYADSQDAADTSKRERHNYLYDQWLTAKERERQAVEDRRVIEDMLIKQFSISDQMEGTKNIDNEGYKIKIVGRINRKVDSEKLQEIAAENGLSEHLSSLFRWKPEINSKAWDAADESITKPLTAAITATPGRPSFSIIKEQ